MHLKLDINLNNLICIKPDDRSDDPYLWTFFLTIDGSTVRQVTGGTNLVSQITVHSAPGSHGNLGVSNVGPGRVIKIPAALGRNATTIRPIRLNLQGETVFIPGRFIAVVILIEEDAAPPTQVMNKAHQKIVNMIHTSITDFFAGLDLNQIATDVRNDMSSSGRTLQNSANTIFTRRITDLTNTIRGRARRAVQTEVMDWYTTGVPFGPGFVWKTITLLDVDDVLGDTNFQFDEETLINEGTRTRTPGVFHQLLIANLQVEENGITRSFYHLNGQLNTRLVIAGDELVETGELVSQIPGDSGEHTFTEAQICVDEGSVASWQLYEQQEEETFVFSYPFLQPVWKINDIELTDASGHIRVRTNCAFPSFDPAKPDGPVYTVREHESTIHFQQFSEGQQRGLRLRNTATDGRYGVLLEVGVRPAGGEYIRVASAMLAFDGLLLESPFFEKYKECMEKFAWPSEKYAPSKPLLPHDLWGPGSRIRWYEQQLQYGRELLALGSIAESEFEHTAAILKKRLAIGPGRSF
jgi:hypothetical protein